MIMDEFKQLCIKVYCGLYKMTDIAKEAKIQNKMLEQKTKTGKDHAEEKPSSETLNQAKVKTEDALT
jgi:hypothetical protein